jgi:hypothetical protein
MKPLSILVATVTLTLVSSTLAAAQADTLALEPIRGAAGGSLVGLQPRGEFAENVNGAFGATGHFLHRLDPQGIIALRADLGFMVYGSEKYRTTLGSGPLGLITVDVNTTNSIARGGLGLQLMAPGASIRPYVNATAGFSYFFTESSVEGINNSNDDFASTTNYDDGGFAWTAGGGLYIPVGAPKGNPLNLDLGVTWIDSGRRRYLRDNGITFENNQVQLNPVESEAQGLMFTLGLSIALRY